MRCDDNLRNSKAIEREIEALEFINETMIENHLADIRTFPALHYIVERLAKLDTILVARKDK